MKKVDTNIMKKISVVIPARYSSQRFPGKIIYPILGVPLIVRVFNSVFSDDFLEVIVLTDDDRVKTVLEEHNIPYLLTDKNCQSGTQRIASIYEKLKGDYIINVQGDEPLISSNIVINLAETLIISNEMIATLAKEEKDIAKIRNENIVKVVLNSKNNALYFSRSIIPFPRSENKKWLTHVGIYGYKKEFFKKYKKFKNSKLENVEKLEQLTFLYNGINICVRVGDYNLHGVDVKDDIEIVEKLLKRKNNK